MIRNTILALASTVLLLTAACGRSEAPNTPPPSGVAVAAPDGVTIDPAKIDAALAGFVARGQVAGISALVYKDGEEAYFGAFGQADPVQDRDMERDTIVQIFSMTKPITGVALMQLWEQDLFELDDPVSDYLPAFADAQVWTGNDADGNPIFAAPDRPITIADLTRHSAGFIGLGEQDTPAVEAMARLDPTSRDKTLAEFGELFPQVPLSYQPGTRWAYSDSVEVQALLVETLSGQPFDVYVRQNIFMPLGMNDTSWFVPEEKRDRMARAVATNPEGGFTPLSDADAFALPFNDLPFKGGGWGLSSTLDDYMKFALMLQNEGSLGSVRILRPETVALMATDHLPADVTDRMWLPGKGQVGFGIDFAVRIAPPAEPYENSGAVGEFFWDGAASTLFWVDPRNDVTAVLFVQLFPFDTIGLHKTFRDAVYAGSAAAAPEPEPNVPEAVPDGE